MTRGGYTHHINLLKGFKISQEKSVQHTITDEFNIAQTFTRRELTKSAFNNSHLGGETNFEKE